MKAGNDGTVKRVMACMVADWGKKETERCMYLAALQTAQYVGGTGCIEVLSIIFTVLL